MYRSGSGIWRVGQSGLATAPAAGGGTDPLYTSLVAYWKMDEASGDRADSVGASTLVDNSGVGSATGLVYSNAASFVSAESDNLTVANNAAISAGDIDFWVATWVYMTALVAWSVIVHKGNVNSVLSEYEWGLLRSSTTTQYAFWLSNGSSGKQLSFPTGTVALDSWVLLVAYHDAANDLVGVSANGAAPTTSAWSGGCWDSALALKVGGHAYITGRVGPMMIGKGYVPDADDLTWLYNSGSGRTLAEMAAL